MYASMCVCVLYMTAGAAVFMFSSSHHPFSISAYPAQGHGKSSQSRHATGERDLQPGQVTGRSHYHS